MSDDLALAGLRKLREPFPPDWTSKLPKPTKRENPKGKCNVCGGWHGLPAVHIDYVGHADITARLLDVDPLWNWRPLAFTVEGVPLISVKDGTASMWIELTVCGMTRLGVGTAAANKEEVQKELIGDALRNAAMRFGAALDLWSKTERSETTAAHEAPQPRKVVQRTAPSRPEPPEPDLAPEPGPTDVTNAVELIRPAQMRKLQMLFNEKGFKGRDDRLGFVTQILGFAVESSKELTVAQASTAINALDRLDDPS